MSVSVSVSVGGCESVCVCAGEDVRSVSVTVGVTHKSSIRVSY